MIDGRQHCQDHVPLDLFLATCNTKFDWSTPIKNPNSMFNKLLAIPDLFVVDPDKKKNGRTSRDIKSVLNSKFDAYSDTKSVSNLQVRESIKFGMGVSPSTCIKSLVDTPMKSDYKNKL